MRMKLTKTLFWKMLLTFFLLIGLTAVLFISLSTHEADQFFNEANQQLHYNLAKYLVEEKFANANPFTEGGKVNKPLFGDIMHDMMAVNRNIEVYLLDTNGIVKYAVVLEEYHFEENQLRVNLQPIRDFIETKQRNNIRSILGDDPRNPGKKKIFSAASFEKEGQKGFIYIILAGKDFEASKANLLGRHFVSLGSKAILISILVAILMGGLLIWYLTKNIRKVIDAMQRFEKGEYQARVHLSASGELTYMANQFNKMAETIVQSIEKVKSAERLRQELIANISHDLRTPLSIVYGYIETFKIKGDALSPDEKQRFINHIIGNIERLKRLVGELFELSKLEAKEIKAKKEPIYVNELIYDLLEKYKLITEEEEISILTNSKLNEKSVMVLADPNLIDRVLENLLDNAIKFTPKGGQVFVNAIQNGDKVAISIQDNGVGIPKSELPNIFNRYYTKTGFKKKEGTGLGLAISKHILELHNSTFDVQSEVSKGAKFSFELPVFTT